MPQRICSECCNKIRQMYLFIVQVQQCNAKLFQKFASKSVTSENMKFIHEVEENGNNKMEDIGESLDAKSYKLLLLKPNFLEVDIETPAGMECGFEETDFDAIQDPAETFHNIPSNIREVCSELGDDQVTTHEEKEIKNTIDTPTSCNAKSTSASGCFSCSYCKKILGSHETLKKHIRKHQNERKVFFTCVYCTRKFPNQHSLNVHLIHKHDVDRKDTMQSGQYTIEGEKFKCQLCDYSSRTYAAFYFHKRSKHGTEEDKIKCKFCSYTNVKKFEMFVHMKNLHLSAVKTLRRNLLKKASVR